MRDNRQDTANLSRFGRRVLTAALSDLGSGNNETSRLVSEWVGTPGFILFCDISGWNDDWVQDVFRRVDEIASPARGPVSSQCVKAMIDLTPDPQEREKIGI
jgi:hypothetical protein|tara:strand:- start:213 stop:518 length:306 start_codon:yes stop_codon:yes gene_type:complete